MPFMEWSDEFALGVGSIDIQHQQFFTFINNLHEAFHLGQGEDILRQTIEELSDYAAFHFQNEKDLFLKIRYPLTLNHEAEHEHFTQKAQEFRDKYQAGNFVLTLAVMDFMKDWLTAHILRSDMKYVHFIREHNLEI